MLKIGLHRHGWNHALKHWDWSQQPHSLSPVQSWEGFKGINAIPPTTAGLGSAWKTRKGQGDPQQNGHSWRHSGTGRILWALSHVTPNQKSPPVAHTFSSAGIDKKANRSTHKKPKEFFLFFLNPQCPTEAPSKADKQLGPWWCLPSRNSNKKN